jgi:hypothetical protein
MPISQATYDDLGDLAGEVLPERTALSILAIVSAGKGGVGAVSPIVGAAKGLIKGFRL